MELKNKTAKILEHLQKEFGNIRSERAHPNLIEDIQAEVYGQNMRLKDIASVSVGDAKTLIVTVWDAANTATIDKAIRNSSLSLNPRVEGNQLYIILPTLTQERRQEFIALVKQKAEQSRIAVRNIRREANDQDKEENKNNSLSDDELKQRLKETQNITDDTMQKIDELLKQKQEGLQNA